jgi:uncharacterized lipoprotein YbaY
MKRFLLSIALAVVAILVGCETTNRPPSTDVIEVEIGETIYINPETGEVYTQEELALFPESFSITLCSFTLENVHQTWWLGEKEVRGAEAVQVRKIRFL